MVKISLEELPGTSYAANVRKVRSVLLSKKYNLENMFISEPHSRDLNIGTGMV
jgi:hypothetical protein